MYAITVKHDDGLTTHINIFFGELIDASHYCEGLKELNSKFGVHGEIYRVHDIGSNEIHIVKEYKRGQWVPVNEDKEDSK